MTKQSGQILPLLIVALAVILVGVLTTVAGSRLFFETSKYSISSEAALDLAEAGIDKAVASLNKSGGSYIGEDETALGEGSYSVKVTDKDTATKIIESTGYIPNKTSPKAKRTIKIKLSRGFGVSFVYGIQVGEGGLQLGNTNVVNGSIYSNGSILGGNGNTITGDVFVAAAPQSNPDQSTDCAPGSSNCQDYLFGKVVSGETRLDVAQSFKPANAGLLNRVKVKLKKIGTPADLTVRILADSGGKPDKNNVLTSGTLSSSKITSSYGFVEVTFSSSPILTPGTSYWLMISASKDTNNYFYWQNDWAQSYNNGLPMWSAKWDSGNPTWTAISPGDLSFQVFLGGAATQIYGNSAFTVNKSVHANTIENLTIQGDAYYQTITNSTVAGQSYPGSTDYPPRSFPLSDANINSWKQQVDTPELTTNGDITSCPSSLGPRKIVGSVTFNSHCSTIVKSPIWITGNLTINTNNHINLDPSYGPISGLIIVDGIISLGSNNQVVGSGTGSSVLLLLTTYDSRSNGVSAIQINNTGNVVVLYADKGIIEPGNSNQFKELTAWGIKLINNGTITYDTGLSSSLFTSGPTGSYSLVKGTYQVE